MPIAITSGFPVVNATPGRNAFIVSNTSQLSYLLDDAPIRDSLQLSLNGIVQTIDVNFTLSGNTVSFIEPSDIRINDLIEVKYLYTEE